MKKVSVLVPVYGVDKYLEGFLDSLSMQNLSDVEFIIVNDASPDCSDDIIKRYLEKDERFIYIKKHKNEGLYKARQDAFDIASGEFVINLDSDDFISADFLSAMYTMAKKEELDIVLSNIDLVDEVGKRLINSKSKSHIHDFVFDYSNIASLLSTPYATWCRMYRKELLLEKNYVYEKGELYLTNFHFLKGVRSGVASSATYSYRIRDNSMSSASNSSKKLQNKLSEISIRNFNNEIFSMHIDKEYLTSYKLFNNLSFTKLNFVSSIYGCEVGRYKALRNLINSEFPITVIDKVRNISVIPRELIVFSILDMLSLVPLLIKFKGRSVK